MQLYYLKRCLTAAAVSGFLLYVLCTTHDVLTRLAVLPFLAFGVAFVLRYLLLLLHRERAAVRAVRVAVAALGVYCVGFLLYWDYVCIRSGDWASLLFSLPVWVGGGYILYRRWNNP